MRGARQRENKSSRGRDGTAVAAAANEHLKKDCRKAIEELKNMRGTGPKRPDRAWLRGLPLWPASFSYDTSIDRIVFVW